MFSYPSQKVEDYKIDRKMRDFDRKKNAYMFPKLCFLAEKQSWLQEIKLFVAAANSTETI